MMLIARNFSIGSLSRIAERTGNAELKKEAERQRMDVLQEREKLTALEPQRLDWWKELSVTYGEMAVTIADHESPAVELEWREKAFAAGEKAASPHCDRPRYRGVRVGNRASLIRSLRKVTPAGWAERCMKLAAEGMEIDAAPLKHGARRVESWMHPELARHWREIVMQLDTPNALRTHFDNSVPSPQPGNESTILSLTSQKLCETGPTTWTKLQPFFSSGAVLQTRQNS